MSKFGIRQAEGAFVLGMAGLTADLAFALALTLAVNSPISIRPVVSLAELL
jgi:hypothetical protein